VRAYQGPEGRKGAPVAAEPPALEQYQKKAVTPPPQPVVVSGNVVATNATANTASDLLDAEKSTFDALLRSHRPLQGETVSELMALQEWSQRVLQAHLDSSRDPKHRLAALGAHMKRMQSLFERVKSDPAAQGHPDLDTVTVARAYVLEARYRLAAFRESPDPASEPAKKSGGAGGFATETADGRKDSAQTELRRKIATLSTRVRDASPRGSAILKKLEEPVSMSFANETPLEDVLKYIKSAAQGPNDAGMPIYVDPDGLAKAEKTMQSPVMLDLEGVPLKVTLRLLLRQLGLAYCVKDGLLMISTPELIAEELEEAEELLSEPGKKRPQ